MVLCMGCMEYINDNEDFCPFCGYRRGTPAKEAHLLSPGTVLNGRYIIGRALGHGGFGVAYIGWDTELERKVAVKEYLPSDFATRMPGDTSLTIYQNEAYEQFHAGLKSFLDEARRLAKFNSKPGIVDIYDIFDQNRTAYIVMQFLDGRNIKQVVQDEGLFPWDKARDIILRVLETLTVVHKEDIIHRDISPENVFITNSGEVKLLDFGAARYATTFHSKSLSVILRPGYAPEEQYRSRGRQGPWTDVYATAATFYKMITGITPEESMERAIKDTVAEPSRLGVQIPKGVENALMNAMNVRMEERTQSPEDFINELTKDDVTRKKAAQHRADTGKFPVWMKAAIAASATALIAVAVIIMSGIFTQNDGGVISVDLAMSDDEVFTPSVLNQSEEEAQRIIETANLAFKISGKDNNDRVAAGTIFSQTPLGGSRVPQGTDVEVEISAGPVSEYMPSVRDKWEEDAVSQLETLGFRVKTTRESGAGAPGAVLSQDISEDAYVPRNSIVNLVISDGYEGLETGKDTDMPEIRGLSVDEAKSILLDRGLYLVVAEEVLDSEIDKGLIIDYDAHANQLLTTGDVVNVVVSMGIKMVRVPDVQYRTLAEATASLEALGLVVDTAYENNDTVVSGNVIRQETASGLEVAPGSTVRIVVSLGADGVEPAQSAPSSRAESSSSQAPSSSSRAGASGTVPYVVGYVERDASSVLAESGFGSSVSYQYSNTVQQGQVISQSPGGGASAQQNSTVSLVVSSGPDPSLQSKEPPNVIGRSLRMATALLEQSGYPYRVEYVYTDDESEHDKVLDGYVLYEDGVTAYIMEVGAYSE